MDPKSWTATAAAQQNSWAREQRAPALSWTHHTHVPRGAKLPNDRLCPELHRKHLGKLDRHHLTKGWEEQQPGVTHGSAKQGGNQNMAAGGTAASGRLLQLHNGCSDSALAVDLASPFSCTELKKYTQLTLLALFWHSLFLFSRCWGNKLLVGISTLLCVAFKHLGTLFYTDKDTGHFPSFFPSSQCWVCLSSSSPESYAWRKAVHRHSFKAHLHWPTKPGDPTSWTVLPLLFYLCHPSQANPAHTLPANTPSASWRPRAWLGKKRELLQGEENSVFLTV